MIITSVMKHSSHILISTSLLPATYNDSHASETQMCHMNSSNSSAKCMLLQYVVSGAFAVAIGSLCWVFYVIRDDRGVRSRKHTGKRPTESRPNLLSAGATARHSGW